MHHFAFFYELLKLFFSFLQLLRLFFLFLLSLLFFSILLLLLPLYLLKQFLRERWLYFRDDAWFHPLRRALRVLRRQEVSITSNFAILQLFQHRVSIFSEWLFELDFQRFVESLILHDLRHQSIQVFRNGLHWGINAWDPQNRRSCIFLISSLFLKSGSSLPEHFFLLSIGKELRREH